MLWGDQKALCTYSKATFLYCHSKAKYRKCNFGPTTFGSRALILSRHTAGTRGLTAISKNSASGILTVCPFSCFGSGEILPDPPLYSSCFASSYKPQTRGIQLSCKSNYGLPLGEGSQHPTLPDSMSLKTTPKDGDAWVCGEALPFLKIRVFLPLGHYCNVSTCLALSLWEWGGGGEEPI